MLGYGKGALLVWRLGRRIEDDVVFVSREDQHYVSVFEQGAVGWFVGGA